MGETRFFVGNVPANTSEDDLQAVFGYYGVVDKVELKKKNESEHFAFVNVQIEERLVEKCKLKLNIVKLFGNKSLPFQVSVNSVSNSSKANTCRFPEQRKVSWSG